MPTLKRKDGRLTSYGLACGYIERHEKDIANRVTLGREHNVYHVKGFLKGKHFWEVKDTLTEARRVFNQKKREMR